ncbi:Uncharacterized protein FWK35_00012854 [Aphis craccivora]|uniref:Uncharacterized protein n=1 Tax=Aphis craccivora TaxID=307492 RepID=A0A6G0YQS8_APHCR|nr:Uncharacterized protein FWK35_00012854 [Aphis craccivora]
MVTWPNARRPSRTSPRHRLASACASISDTGSTAIAAGEPLPQHPFPVGSADGSSMPFEPGGS